MSNIEEEKIKEEIKGLKVDRYFTIFKGIALLLGSIGLFIIIQMPESVLNKKASQETINRERAKLILEVIHSKSDLESIILEISVIEKAYPETDTVWLSAIKNIYITKLNRKNNTDLLNKIDTSKDKRILHIRMELDNLYNKKEMLQSQYMMEITGQGGTKRQGIGPAAKAIRQYIYEITYRISRKEHELDSLK